MLRSARRASGVAPSVAAPAKSLLWLDDFVGPAGSAANPANWTYDVGRGTSGWGNSELEYYVDPVATPAFRHCAQLDGLSRLVLSTYHETTPDNVVPSAPGDTAYTSARLKTLGLRDFSPPCRVAAKMLIPWTPGLWPAFWMVGNGSKAAVNYTNWPAVGEIDILEAGLGAAPGLQGNLHVGRVGALATNIGLNSFKVGQEYTPAPRWAVYGVDWYADHLAWHVDGVVLGSLTQAQVVAANGDWTPLGASGWPFYILLNSAVGGTGGGAPSAASVFPQSVLIDWVGVWTI